MKLPQDSQRPSAAVPVSASGALVAVSRRPFVPRLPSTWPTVDTTPDTSFADVLERLFVEGMMAELNNVCGDILASNPAGLQGSGHVVGVAMMSILDSVSQFAYPAERQRDRIPRYVYDYFAAEYHVIAQDLSDRYRNGLIHEWFMREVAFLPRNEPLVIQSNGSPILGLLTFRDALSESIHRFLADLRVDPARRRVAAVRYSSLQQHVRD
jgi:hypothetical protein